MTNAQILIVEDERIVAKDIQNRLEAYGYGVIAIASSGEEAIEKTEDTKPDLVLMDIVIKGDIGGVEAAKLIREHFDIPVVYLTAYADEKTFTQAITAEPYGYIVKPFRDIELITTINTALYKHRMEKRLKENERWLATTLKSIGDAVITTDGEGIVKFMNSTAEALTGWNNDQALGKRLKEVLKILDEKTRVMLVEPLLKAIETGVYDSPPNQALLEAKDGTEALISRKSAPIKDEKGNVTGMVVVFRDITEQTKMKEEILRTQKLESLAILAGGIAHDFNNLLTAILGNISLAKMSIGEEHTGYAKLAEAERACLKTKDLTQQLITFFKGANRPGKQLL